MFEWKVEDMALLNQIKEFNSNQEDFKERIERYNSGKLS